MSSLPFQHDEADASPGFLLWKLTALWQAQVSAALAEFELTQTQYALLASVRWFERSDTRPTQRQLVDHTKIDKMTLSKAIRRLEDAELVGRRRSTQDARATQVMLTDKGRNLVDFAIRTVERADNEFFTGLQSGDLDHWTRLTRALIAAHTEDNPTH